MMNLRSTAIRHKSHHQKCFAAARLVYVCLLTFASEPRLFRFCLATSFGSVGGSTSSVADARADFGRTSTERSTTGGPSSRSSSSGARTTADHARTFSLCLPSTATVTSIMNSTSYYSNVPEGTELPPVVPFLGRSPEIVPLVDTMPAPSPFSSGSGTSAQDILQIPIPSRRSQTFSSCWCQQLASACGSGLRLPGGVSQKMRRWFCISGAAAAAAAAPAATAAQPFPVTELPGAAQLCVLEYSGLRQRFSLGKHDVKNAAQLQKSHGDAASGHQQDLRADVASSTGTEVEVAWNQYATCGQHCWTLYPGKLVRGPSALFEPVFVPGTRTQRFADTTRAIRYVGVGGRSAVAMAGGRAGHTSGLGAAVLFDEMRNMVCKRGLAQSFYTFLSAGSAGCEEVQKSALLSIGGGALVMESSSHDVDFELVRRAGRDHHTAPEQQKDECDRSASDADGSTTTSTRTSSPSAPWLPATGEDEREVGSGGGSRTGNASRDPLLVARKVLRTEDVFALQELCLRIPHCAGFQFDGRDADRMRRENPALFISGGPRPAGVVRFLCDGEQLQEKDLVDVSGEEAGAAAHSFTYLIRRHRRG